MNPPGELRLHPRLPPGMALMPAPDPAEVARIEEMRVRTNAMHFAALSATDLGISTGELIERARDIEAYIRGL